MIHKRSVSDPQNLTSSHLSGNFIAGGSYNYFNDDDVVDEDLKTEDNILED